jgi:DNA-binding transcriptional LysR family regulator
MGMYMNFELLKTLQAVVTSGSISEAANLLYKTQPAVSMSIKRLESDVGFELFDRSGYRLELTAKGKIYYQKTKQILAQVNQLNSLSESYTRGEEHEVKIAFESTADVNDMMRKIVPIQRQFPNTELHLQGVQMLNALKLLTEKKVDLAVTPWTITFESVGDFDSKIVAPLNFKLCIHKDLLKPFNIDKADQITVEVLRQITQLTPIKLPFNMDKTSLSKQISNSIVKIDDISCFLAALNAQLGWGPITDSAWTSEMEQNLIRFKLPEISSEVNAEIRIVKNRAKVLGPAAQAIWDSL